VRSLNRFILIAALIVANIVVLAQTRPAGGTIQGIVQSGGTPLPGVTVTATNSTTNEKVTTSTDPNGQYQLKVPATGTYNVETTMSAFATSAKPANVSDASTPLRLDFDLTLASRTQQAAAQPPPATVGLRGRGAQTLRVQQTANPNNPTQENQPEELTAQVPNDVQVPGFAQDAPTESVAVLGNTAETTFGNNFNFDREQIQQFIDQQFGVQNPGGQGGQGQDGGFGGQGGQGGQQGGRGGQGGFQGGNRGGGGFQGNRGGGQRGGNRGFAFGRGGRGFGSTAPRGNISYQVRDSDLDAAPYNLKGQQNTKPQYTQNNFSATLGGPLYIPHIVKSTSTNYTVTYTGTRNRNPNDAFSTVPTLAERSGDFSESLLRNGSDAGTPVQLFDPLTHQPIANNVLPSGMLSPSAVGLLKFIPAPNLPGTVQNFHFTTATTNSSNNVNIRMNHTFGNTQQQQGRGRNQFAGGQRGGGGGGRGGGGRGRGTNINFGLQIQSQHSDNSAAFPTVGGHNDTKGLNSTFGFVRQFGRINNSVNVNYNRSNRTGTNLYAFQQDIAGLLGISGVSTNPFDWGIPNLSFTNFTGLNDFRSSEGLNQTMRLTDGLNWNRGKHNVRFGGDASLVRNNIHSTQNSRGTFTFTGARTAAVGTDGKPIQGTGYDFADFLLGLPQQTTLQFGNLTYRFRGSSWDVYVQDDWRLRGNLTVQLGLRYDYASPYTEANNQIVNIDVAPGFTAAVPVLPGASGALTGVVFPKSLVNPDRNNVSPRVGFAYRFKDRTVLRGGYGITYNGAAYAQIASQMANQPPFSIAETNINSAAIPLTLTSGFPVLPSTVTNTYGIDPDYKIGYAQQWNLDLQRDIRKLGLQMNLDYTGTKGTRLDVLEAPNRTATGLRIANVQPFNWETSQANSILHSGAIRINRRLGRGISFGGTYQFSKTIDNAYSLGGAGAVAQDAFNLRAERGISSIDQPHRLNINYNFELPFGTNKPFLAEASPWKTMFGDWQFTGNWGINSGTPLTARVLGSYTDVNRGSNGSLRANATGLPVSIGDPGVAEWFNVAAFTLPPSGQFGNVGRNTLRGPKQIIDNLRMQKTFLFNDGRSLNVSAQSQNFLNIAQFRGIDTTVNSPTFGRVISAGQMRTIMIIARYNF
jgi:hypothetical protein